MSNSPDKLVVTIFEDDRETLELLSPSDVAVVLDAAMPESSRLNLLAHLGSANPAVTIVVKETSGSTAALPGVVPERLVRAARYIQDHCARPLYLDRMAREACLSKFHFSREFKRYFGVSPIQFLINSRIILALDLIAEGKVPLAQVAVHCGFSDQSQFTKWFKRLTGSTPSSYRSPAMQR